MPSIITDSAYLIETVEGKQIYIVNNYPYYKKHVLKKANRWACNKYGCKAFLRVSDDFKILDIVGDHAHTPSHYFKLSSGKYTRV